MSNVSRRRPEFALGQPTILEMYAVPETGEVTVRFLADPVGVLIHKRGNDRIPCAGNGECRPELHRTGVTWKGYCAAERWRHHPYGDWVPCVFEVTRALAAVLGNDPLRARVWSCYRELNRYGHQECTGHQVDKLSPSELDPAFDVRGVVMSVYNTHLIHFGQKDPMPGRVLVATKKDYTPPTAIQPEKEKTPEEKAADMEETRKLLKQAIAGKFKPTTSRPEAGAK